MFDNYAALSQPQSAEQLCRAMQVVCREAGTPHFMAASLGGLHGDEITQLLHNASKEAEARLTVARHWSVDRMVDTVRKSGVPMLFGGEGEPSMDVPGFEYGAGALTRFGIRSYVLFFGRPGDPVEVQDGFLLMGAVQVAAQCAAPTLAALMQAPCTLTERELQCLTHYVADCSPKQTAHALGISARTVEHHLERARVRLRVDATLTAATIAMRNGWISPDDIQAIKAAA